MSETPMKLSPSASGLKGYVIVDCAAAPRLTAQIIKAISRFIGLGLRANKIRHKSSCPKEELDPAREKGFA